jgi:hypothetical protein
VNRLKQFRRIATRYDKRACNYLATLARIAAFRSLPFASQEPREPGAGGRQPRPAGGRHEREHAAAAEQQEVDE